MCVLGRAELERLIRELHAIRPFNPSLLDGDSYVLTVREDVTLRYLEHKNLTTKEVVFTPPGYVAHLTAKSRFGRMGLSFLNAAKVHSGFVGRLALEVVNLNNDRAPITIRHDDPFMHIEFVQRLGEPSPYEGEYMFQYMSDDEVRLYTELLLEKFGTLYDAAKLAKLALQRLR
jgi:dCTP deaminase